MLKRIVKPEAALAVIILLMLAFQLILAFNNTLAHDDYLFLDLYNEHGFNGSIVYWYYSWQGRISAYVFTNLTLFAERYTNGLFIYFLVLIALFISGIYFLFVNTLKRLKINHKVGEVLIFAAYLFIFFQEIVYDKSTIYWVAASASYYAGLAFLIAGTALIISQGTDWLKLALLILIFLIVGCSLEHLAFIAFFILCGFSAAAFILKEQIFFGDNKLKLCISVLALGAGIAIMMLCPGLENRRVSFPKPDLISAIKISANSFYHFYKFMFLPDIGKIILFSAPFIYLGHKLKSNDNRVEIYSPVRTILVILLLLLAVITLNFLIMAKGTGGMGQPRTLFHLAFFIALCFSVIAFICGYTLQVSKPVALLLTYAGIVVFLISGSQNYLRTLPESVKYSTTEKSRIEFLLQEKAKGRTEPIVLDSLYYNQYVLYRTNEVSSDTAGHWNQALKRALGLDFNISAVTANYSED